MPEQASPVRTPGAIAFFESLQVSPPPAAGVKGKDSMLSKWIGRNGSLPRPKLLGLIDVFHVPMSSDPSQHGVCCLPLNIFDGLPPLHDVVSMPYFQWNEWQRVWPAPTVLPPLISLLENFSTNAWASFLRAFAHKEDHMQVRRCGPCTSERVFLACIPRDLIAERHG